MCYGEVYYIYLDNRLWFIHIQKTIRTLYFGVKFREAILYPKHNVELQKYIRGFSKDGAKRSPWNVNKERLVIRS